MEAEKSTICITDITPNPTHTETKTCMTEESTVKLSFITPPKIYTKGVELEEICLQEETTITIPHTTPQYNSKNQEETNEKIPNITPPTTYPLQVAPEVKETKSNKETTIMLPNITPQLGKNMMPNTTPSVLKKPILKKTILRQEKLHMNATTQKDPNEVSPNLKKIYSTTSRLSQTEMKREKTGMKHREISADGAGNMVMMTVIDRGLVKSTKKREKKNLVKGKEILKKIYSEKVETKTEFERNVDKPRKSFLNSCDKNLTRQEMKPGELFGICLKKFTPQKTTSLKDVKTVEDSRLPGRQLSVTEIISNMGLKMKKTETDVKKLYRSQQLKLIYPKSSPSRKVSRAKLHSSSPTGKIVKAKSKLNSIGRLNSFLEVASPPRHKVRANPSLFNPLSVQVNTELLGPSNRSTIILNLNEVDVPGTPIGGTVRKSANWSGEDRKLCRERDELEGN